MSKFYAFTKNAKTQKTGAAMGIVADTFEEATRALDSFVPAADYETLYLYEENEIGACIYRRDDDGAMEQPCDRDWGARGAWFFTARTDAEARAMLAAAMA